MSLQTKHSPRSTWFKHVLTLFPSESSESWTYPLTDSSYDSLENELDNSSGGSPGVCSRRHLHEPRQGSLDSILTFSDYDQDADPDIHHTQFPDRSTSSKDAATEDMSSTLDALSLDCRHKQRRRSEPAIAYMAKLQPCVSGSSDGLAGGDELVMKSGSHTLSYTHYRGPSRRSEAECGSDLHGGRSAALEASSSSLSSTPNSPAPTRSSPDSLDSLCSDQTWATRRGPTKTQLSCSSSGSPATIISTLTSGGHQDLGTSSKGSPPKEQLNWGTLKGCRGLHPNCWLKKDRRLSLTQQDNLDKEEEDKTRVRRVML